MLVWGCSSRASCASVWGALSHPLLASADTAVCRRYVDLEHFRFSSESVSLASPWPAARCARSGEANVFRKSATWIAGSAANKSHSAAFWQHSAMHLPNAGKPHRQLDLSARNVRAVIRIPFGSVSLVGMPSAISGAPLWSRQ